MGDIDLIRSLELFFSRSWLDVLRDVGDIGIVSVLVYWTLTFLRGTRAMQMVFGLGLVFLIHQLAKVTGLITVWSILDVFLSYAVLIVVVIFQEDIRRALSRAGRRRLLRRNSVTREDKMIDVLILAASRLSKHKIGALIVIEKDTSLDEFAEQGILLDAELSPELLVSAFVPSGNNPLHDGAVILREGRVWKAGCVLPLSQQFPLAGSSQMGTRHRAALGLTEHCDAIVLVVSEENGSLSLCYEGVILRRLDIEGLRSSLIKLMIRKRKEGDVHNNSKISEAGDSAFPNAQQSKSSMSSK